MKKTPPLFFLLASLISVQPAIASNLPEVIAFDAANEAAAQIFSSPALPSLDNEGASITPLFGVVTMEGVDETAMVQDGPEFTIHNKGEIKGNVAGLSFNFSGQGDLGFFATAAWTKVSGEMHSSYDHVVSVVNDIRDISAETYIGVVGLNYRLVGTAKSFFALGVFGGPAMISSKTSAKFVHADGTSTNVKLDPETTAAYIGLQMMFRPGNFRINPYLNLLGNTSVGCYKPTYEGDPYPAGQYNQCMNGEPGVSAFAGIVGAGINVGYGRFNFGLVQSASGTNQAFKSKPLVFSLRVPL